MAARVTINRVAFQLNNATGNQTISDPDGPGQTPKFALFVFSGATATDTITNTARASWGMTDGTTHLVTGYMAELGALAVNADTGRRVDNATVIQICQTGSQGLDYEGAWVSFGTNEVVISNSAARQYRGYVVLGYGDDLEAVVSSLTSNATQDATASLSGLPFPPDAIIAFFASSGFAADTAISHVIQSMGFAARVPSTTQSSYGVACTDLATPTAVASIVRDDAILTRITNALALSAWIEVTDWFSDGWEITTRNASVAVVGAYLSLRLGGRKCSAEALTLVTSSTGDTDFNGYDFRPHFLMMVANDQEAVNTLDTDRCAHSVGAGNSAGASVAVGWNDQDGQTVSSAYCISSALNLVEVLLTNTTWVWQAELTDILDDGFRYNVLDTDAGDKFTPTLAIAADVSALGRPWGSSRGSASIIRLRAASAVARGSSFAVGVATVTGSADQTATGVATGSSIARVRTAGIIRLRAATTAVRGSSLATGAIIRLKATAAVVRGSSLATGAIIRLKAATTAVRGSSLVTGSVIRLKVAVAEVRGSSRANVTPTRARTASGTALGSSVSTGVAAVTGAGEQAVDGAVLGSSLATGSVVRLRRADARSGGSALALAAPSLTRRATSAVRGSTLANAVTARVRLATAVAVGAARAVGTTTRLKPVLGRAFGAAITVAVASRLKPASALARGGAVVSGAVARRRNATTSVRASAMAVGTTGRARMASGTSRGSSFAVGRFGIKAVAGFGGGSSLARAWATVTTSVCTALDTDLDDRILPKALDVVTRLGRRVTFVLVGSQSYSTATGRVTKVGVSQVSRVASPPLYYSDEWIDGETIRQGDAQLIVPELGLGFVPERKMDVLFDDGRWTIESVQLVRSGNRVAIYILQIRGAKAPRASTTSVQNDLDTRLPFTARRLIEKYGKRVIFHVASARLRDVPAGTTIDVGNTEFCELVVFDPTNRSTAPGWTSESEEGDGYLRAEGLGFDPYKGMRVEFSGQRWVVASLEPIYTGGRVGAWKLGFGM